MNDAGIKNEVICEVTGEIVASDSEEWRHDCECRYASDLIDKDRTEAKRYFAKVKQIRGADAFARLFDDVTMLRSDRRKRGVLK